MSEPIYPPRSDRVCEICQDQDACLSGQDYCELSGEIHDPFTDTWHTPSSLLALENPEAFSSMILESLTVR